MNTEQESTPHFPTEFKDKEYRVAYIDAHIGNTISAQVHGLRKKRGWSQTQLAREAEMAQARISLLEDPDYGKFTLSTLKRIAAAFDVALIVKFSTFSEFLADVEGFSNESVNLLSFDQEQGAMAWAGFAPGGLLPGSSGRSQQPFDPSGLITPFRQVPLTPAAFLTKAVDLGRNCVPDMVEARQ